MLLHFPSGWKFFVLFLLCFFFFLLYFITISINIIFKIIAISAQFLAIFTFLLHSVNLRTSVLPEAGCLLLILVLQLLFPSYDLNLFFNIFICALGSKLHIVIKSKMQGLLCNSAFMHAETASFAKVDPLKSKALFTCPLTLSIPSIWRNHFSQSWFLKQVLYNILIFFLPIQSFNRSAHLICSEAMWKRRGGCSFPRKPESYSSNQHVL